MRHTSRIPGQAYRWSRTHIMAMLRSDLNLKPDNPTGAVFYTVIIFFISRSGENPLHVGERPENGN